MEEYVGNLWHRLITRATRTGHAEAAVQLSEIEKTAGVLFRALGGDPGLRVSAATDTRHGARRRWLARVAGTQEHTAHAARDGEALQLPEQIAHFPDRETNRDLYLWLAALAACDLAPEADWITRNQRAAQTVLQRFPGLAARYRRLLQATLQMRIEPARLPPDEAAAERAIRAALAQPGSVAALPQARRPPQPVPLWLYGGRAKTPASQSTAEHRDDNSGERSSEDGGRKRRRAKRVETGDGKDGLLMIFRAESVFSWAEFVRVNRSQDDDENPDAARAANDMDEMAIARDGNGAASRLRFDLDLPSAAHDDLPLTEGILLPEWNYKKRRLEADRVRIVPLSARDATAQPLPRRLAASARRLRAQFSALTPARRWLKDQPEGTETDIDAFVRQSADRLAGAHGGRIGGYLAPVACARDLSCLVLADLSLSTDAWVGDEHRVIDVIRDSLWLTAEALAATGDRYALWGFSSLKRGHVRLHRLKDFDERYDNTARGRIAAIRPGYYTRLGAAIRFGTQRLAREGAGVRLLLILTDGKPNDLDHYEGRFGIEDTRAAVMEARKAGLRPFCVTIDREGESYLPHLFGPGGYTVVGHAQELPRRLPALYAQLTRS